MKKQISILAASLILLCSCGENVEEQAEKRLSAAQIALQSEQFSEAKRQLDSIKILYPKAYQARKKGLNLMLQVELAEQQKSKIYLDSMLLVKQKEVAELVPQFILEKDTTYQQVGNYFCPNQTVEKTLHRSFLRFQVSEQGILTLTTVYCGNRSLHHQSIRVTAPDGTTASTPVSTQGYETKVLNEYIEKIDYKLGNDGGVIDFIYQNSDKRLKVEFIGQKTRSITLEKQDQQVLKKIYPLAQALSSLQYIQENLKEANLKIRFLNKKITD